VSTVADRRSRLQFALDRLPWWLWPIKDGITWLACKTTGHVPMQSWNPRAGAYWHCAWCLNDVPAPEPLIPPMRLDDLERECRESRSADGGEASR
jgi:hypothetical protein